MLMGVCPSGQDEKKLGSHLKVDEEMQIISKGKNIGNFKAGMTAILFCK